MSIESLAIAMNHSKATGNIRCVLYAIANNDGEGGSWPSVATISRRCGGLNRRNVQRAIERLEEMGEIRRVIQAGGTPEMDNALRPNRYLFLLECPPYCDRTTNHRDLRKPLIVLDDELADRVAVAPPGGGSATHPVAVAPPKPSFNYSPRLKKETYVLKPRLSPSQEADLERQRVAADPPIECEHGRVQVLCGACMEVMV
jgi:hypothetical protein